MARWFFFHFSWFFVLFWMKYLNIIVICFECAWLLAGILDFLCHHFSTYYMFGVRLITSSPAHQITSCFQIMKHSYSTEENNKHKNNAFSKIISYYSTRSFSNSVKLSSTENGLLSSNTTRKHILASCSFLFYSIVYVGYFFFCFFPFIWWISLCNFLWCIFVCCYSVAFEVHCRTFFEIWCWIYSCAGIWSEYGRSFGVRLKYVVYSPLPWLYGIHHIV